jgi:N-acetylneuraminic acid mutarotase
VEYSGDVPCPRKLFSASYFPKHEEIFIFGGQTLEKKPKQLNDAFRFNVKEKTWKKVETQEMTPKPRSGHASVVMDEKLFVFGGSQTTKESVLYFKDLNAFDVETNTWSKIQTSGDVPSARDGHGFLNVSGTVYLHGGWTSNSTSDNSVYKFDISSLQWTKVKEIKDSERFSHTFAYLDSSFVLFGGRNQEFKILNDIVVFELENKKELENLTQTDDIPEKGWIHVDEKKEGEETTTEVVQTNLFETKEKKQVLDDVIIKKAGAKKKKKPTKKVDISSTVTGENYNSNLLVEFS